jgi:serine phosphatase RsbU (regulator of sigma subunit)/pSer/pThr/pTyr-binding forkhead associated (FHA) protein
MTPGQAPNSQPASLVVIDPHGNRSRVAVEPLPFRIGRQGDNHLVIRDSRASRSHARIVVEEGNYWVEDCGSRHGTFINGERITKRALNNSDRIDFGVPESYQLVFALDGAELKRLMIEMNSTEKAAPIPGVGGNLVKLRAILDLARVIQSSFSIEDVLTAVVDAALAVTGAERGFLLLRSGDGLETKVARHRQGHRLNEDELRVPREVIHRALQNRRELLSMNFDPLGIQDTRPKNSIADLELRSVVCVPLVRMRTAMGDVTNIVPSANDTVGVLYMDSRLGAADMAGGNRELLQTLAIEASTVLENARLLEEERAKQQMDEELRLARTIQQSLLPQSLPKAGWLVAKGSSVASRQVGGDYFDVRSVTPECWSVVVADVSGKGVSSALLASLLQGALITATDRPEAVPRRMDSLNQFLNERTGGEKYATVFYGLIDRAGMLRYVNAAHCPPIVIRGTNGPLELQATSVPVGLMDPAEFVLAEYRLQPGDKIVIYSDGVTEAQNTAGDFFGKKRLRELVTANTGGSCAAIHDALQAAVTAFTEGAPQSDDITLVVLEFGNS